MLFAWIKGNFIWVTVLGIIAFAIQTAIRSWTGKKKRIQIISSAAAVLYMSGLIYVTLSSREMGAEYKYKLELFWSYRKIINEGNKFYLWENMANVVAFIPLGIFLFDFIGEKLRWYHAVLVGLICSAGIECSQLVWKLGLFEFDDMFHNTLGTWIGFSLAVFISRAVSAILGTGSKRIKKG